MTVCGRMLLLALAYFALARFGLLLAIPPGYSSAFWAPAGVALMALLGGGSRLWPGIVAGSFAHNLMVSSANGHGGASALVVSAVIGVGAALQALAGAALVRRHVGYPTALTRLRETLHFLLLGGPLACLVSASVGIATLSLAGAIPAKAIAFSWFNWWAGDAIGVLLVVPFWLVAAGEPRELWRARWPTVALPVLAMVLGALGAFAVAQRQEAARIQAEFTVRAQDVKRRLEDAVEDDLVLLDTIRGHFDATPVTDSRSFSVVARSVLFRHGSLRALEWAPSVRPDERAAFERTRDGSGAGVAITERTADGGIAPRSPAGRYVPVLFIEPLDGNNAARGYDLASEPARAAAIDAAVRAGVAVLTAPLKLVQLPDDEVGLLAFVPVYRSPPAAGAPLPADVRGFVVGAIAVPQLMQAALGAINPAGLDYRLVDATDPARPVALGGHHDPRDPAVDPAIVRPVEAAVHAPGRAWRLEVRPTLGFIDAARSPMPWLTQICGLLFAALIGTLLMELAGRRQQVVEEVALRTRELSERNQQLLHEIGERVRAQAEVKRSEERYRALIEQSPLMVVLGRDSRFLYANQRFLDVHRIARLDQLVGLPLIERVAPEARAEFAARANARQLGLPAENTYETVSLRSDGSRVPIKAFVDVVELPDGPATIGFFEDQTERLAMEAARRESDARFEAAFENTANGIVIEDREGRIQRVNPAMCAFLGYTREELLGANLYDLTFPDDLASSAERARELWSGAIASYQHEKRYVHRDGHPRWAGISCALIRDADGAPRYLVAQVQDLAERKRLEKALIEATNTEQQRLGHELHDGLGQELTGMAMLIAALRGAEARAGRDVSPSFVELEAIAKRTIATCRAIAHGLSPLSYVRGDLIAALRELVALQHQAYAARTRFDAVEAAGLALPPHALDHLYRIAQEAISNARRHAEARTISVTLTVEPTFVRLEVVDDGRGLELAEEQASGMGLKIMRYRAGMIGATLEIASLSEGGTRVACECPQAWRADAAAAGEVAGGALRG